MHKALEASNAYKELSSSQVISHREDNIMIQRQVSEQLEQYLRQDLGYSQSGSVILAIRAADRCQRFNKEFGVIAISSTEIYVVTGVHVNKYFNQYFEKAMQTAHLCWWNDTFSKELSVEAFKKHMERL